MGAEVKQAKVADAIVKQAAEYVEATQPIIDEYNTLKHAFQKRAHEIAGVLCNRGIIARHEKDALVDKLASSPALAFDLVEKVAGMVGPDGLGKGSNEVQEAGNIDTSDLDPFQKLAMFGDSRVDARTANTGLVE